MGADFATGLAIHLREFSDYSAAEIPLASTFCVRKTCCEE